MRTRQISPYFDILEDETTGEQRMVVYLEGIAVLRLVLTNKGTAFTPEERKALGIDGLLPPAFNTIEQQVERVYAGYKQLPTPIAKYQFLRQLQERQEILFFALLSKHLTEMLPIVYTPTVGDAVKQWNALYQTPRGLALSPNNIDNALGAAKNYPMEDVRMIVATDSSAILGIGDQGYGGLAIPIGKLALYTAGGGVSPFHTLPVVMDVGTDRQDLIDDPFYLGYRAKRLTGEAYLDFIDKFVAAVKERWPMAVIQWEDLSKDVAFEVLERHRKNVASFNDDVQGTGAVALAGVLSACRLNGQKLSEQVVIVHGAGAGGVGVAEAIRQGMLREGLSTNEARRRLLVLDSGGLLCERRGIKGYKAPYAQAEADIAGWTIAGKVPDLLECVREGKATVLLGLSGQPGAFPEAVVRAAAANAERPIIFPLSNPTASSEAIPADLFAWTDGKVRCATGSPFEPVVYGDEAHVIGQGNNAFIFPGLGLAAILGYVREVSDAMVMTASDALTEYTTAKHPTLLYPPVAELDEVSIHVATKVLERALADGLGQLPQRWVDKGALNDIAGYVRSHFWRPKYLPFIKGETRPF